MLSSALCFRCPRVVSAFVSILLTVVIAVGLPRFATAQNTPGGGMLAVKPSSAADAPVPAASDVRFTPAKVLKRPAPAYPVLAQLNRVEGVVKLRFGIDEQGHVSTLGGMDTSGSIYLDSVVLDPVLKTWTFQPATLDGKPIASSLEQELEFRLDPAEQRKQAIERLALQPNALPDPPYPPEAVQYKLKGTCTISVVPTEAGLVDRIFLDQPTGSKFLDNAALRWAFTHWRVDPKKMERETDKDGSSLPKRYTKSVTFTPPAVP